MQFNALLLHIRRSRRIAAISTSFVPSLRFRSAASVLHFLRGRDEDFDFGVGVGFGVGAGGEAFGRVGVEEVVRDVVEPSEVGEGSALALLTRVCELFGCVEAAEGLGDGFGGAGFDGVVAEVESICGRVVGCRGSIEEEDALDAFERRGGGVDRREERLEDCRRQRLEVFGDLLSTSTIRLRLARFRGEVIHDQQRRSQILLPPAPRPLLTPLHIFTQTIRLDAEMQRRPPRRHGQSQIRIPAATPTEQHQVRHSKRASHGGIVPQLITPSLFQSGGSLGLHHGAHVSHELRHAGPDLAGSHADDHAFGGAVAGFLGGIAWCGCGALRALFDSAFGHCSSPCQAKATGASRALNGDVENCAKISRAEWLRGICRVFDGDLQGSLMLRRRDGCATMSAMKKRKLDPELTKSSRVSFPSKHKKARLRTDERSKPVGVARESKPKDSRDHVRQEKRESRGGKGSHREREKRVEDDPREGKGPGDASERESFGGFDDEGSEPNIEANGSNRGVPVTQDESVAPVSKGAEDATPPKTFADLGVIDSLCDACTSLGYKTPTAIQNEAIPIALAGRDIIGLAETGSGKTAAFALPILQALLDAPQPMFGLVLAPTRELAYQISQQFEALGSLIGVRCAVIVGGMDMVPQAIALAKKPHIVVATPGRLLDHLENTKGFSLRQLKYLVMDEADRLLDLDFGPIFDKILHVLPRTQRKTSLFSATMNAKLDNLTRAALQNPVRVSISSSTYQTVKNLLQRYIFIPHKFKDVYLVALLHEHAGQSCILFTRTVHETQRLAFLLRALGSSAIPLHGQLAQSARLGALNKFRAGSRDILVATDVAARGLDIPSVDLVLNYDLPPDSKTYVHRVGRTARAGKSGVAVSVVTQYDIEIFQRIEKALGKRLEERGMAREEVMVFAQRVGEAQRVAITEMKGLKERDARGNGRGKGIGGGRAKEGGRRGEGMDVDEG